MSSSPPIDRERTVVIRNPNGLHARPAAEFVKLAVQFRSDVLVRKDDTEVNGKSIMGVLVLAAEFGSQLTIRAVGSDADEAVERLAGMIENMVTEEHRP